MDILKILGNEKRRAMLRILVKKSVHISALARELNISKPAALKHLSLLESANFVERAYVGNSVVIKIKDDTIELLKKLEDIMEKPAIIKAKKGERLYDVLKDMDGIEIKKWPGTNKYYIQSIDGIPGYYIFLVNGKLPNLSADEYIIDEDMILEFQKLIPVIGRRIEVKID